MYVKKGVLQKVVWDLVSCNHFQIVYYSPISFTQDSLSWEIRVL